MTYLQIWTEYSLTNNFLHIARLKLFSDWPIVLYIHYGTTLQLYIVIEGSWAEIQQIVYFETIRVISMRWSTCSRNTINLWFFVVVMYPAYAKWIKSHRDLPLKLNQWNNVVVWFEIVIIYWYFIYRIPEV